MTYKNNALILLSGGLDSVVSIKASACKIKLGIIFNYGQLSFGKEYSASKQIADYYNFPLIKIDLTWLGEIIDNGLTSKEKSYIITDFTDEKQLTESMKSVWVPNRNALFINIAASYCEAKNIDKIIIGANAEEGKTFKDNTKEFIDNINEALKFSANTSVQVIAPLINMSKAEIIKTAIKNNTPLELIYSCYRGKDKHCGICESCLHLKKALVENGRTDLIKKLF